MSHPDVAFCESLILPEDRGLRRVRVTPDQFRHRAQVAGWRPKSIDLFLRRPLCKSFVAVGDKGADRVLALVCE